MARHSKPEEAGSNEEGTQAVQQEDSVRIDYLSGVQHMAETGRIPGAYMNLPGDMQAMIRVIAYGFLALIQVLQKK